MFPDGYFLGWTPGQRPRVKPGNGMAWRLDPGSDLVIEMHMMPTDTTQYMQASVGLHFTDEAPTQSAYMIRIGRQDIDIPAGEPNWINTDSYTLPVDVDVLGVQPHAHYLGQEIRGYATLPDGSIKSLVYIKDWDCHWQDVYQFSEPLSLPKGPVLTMHYSYDNSARISILPVSRTSRDIWTGLWIGDGNAVDSGPAALTGRPRNPRSGFSAQARSRRYPRATRKCSS